MFANVVNYTSKTVKLSLASKTIKAALDLDFSSFIDSFLNEESITLSNNEIHQEKDGLWHLTKSKDKDRVQFHKNIDYMNKVFSKFRSKLEAKFNDTKNIFEKEMEQTSHPKNRSIFSRFIHLRKPKYDDSLSYLYHSINKLLNINSTFSKSSYMPSISENFIGKNILIIKDLLNELQKNQYLAKKNSALMKIISEFCAIIADLDLNKLIEMVKFNKEYKLNKIDKKIALINLNKQNPDYIKLKYSNKNLIDNMYYYNKNGNLRVSFESAEDEINQLKQNKERINSDIYPGIYITPSSSKEKHIKLTNDSKYTTGIVKNGKQIGKTYISPKSLDFLFANCFPTQNIGDCYLVNVFNQIMHNDKQRIKLYNCFQEVQLKDGNEYIKVKFPQLKFHLLYKITSDYSWIKHNKGSLWGTEGFRMLEEVYCVNRIIERLDKMEKSDLFPNDIKQLVKKYKSTIKEHLFDTSSSLDERIKKLSYNNKEIAKVFEYTYKKIVDMKYNYLEQLHNKNFISDYDYKNYKQNIDSIELNKVILYLTPFLEKENSELLNFKNKTEKENYYKNYVKSIKCTDVVPYNDTFYKLDNLIINGFKTLEGGKIGEVAKAFGYKIKTKFVKRLNQKEYPEISLLDDNYHFSNVQPEGGLVSHHAQSIIGMQKYGLRLQEPNTSDHEQIVIFDYYPKLFNDDKKEQFQVIECYS